MDIDHISPAQRGLRPAEEDPRTHAAERSRRTRPVQPSGEDRWEGRESEAHEEEEEAKQRERREDDAEAPDEEESREFDEQA